MFRCLEEQNALPCSSRAFCISPDTLLDGVPFVIFQICVEFLQFKKSFFACSFNPSCVKRRRLNSTIRDSIRCILQLPGRKEFKWGYYAANFSQESDARYLAPLPEQTGLQPQNRPKRKQGWWGEKKRETAESSREKSNISTTDVYKFFSKVSQSSFAGILVTSKLLFTVKK